MKPLISLIALITQLIFLTNRALIAVLMHILLYFSICVPHAGRCHRLLKASLLLVLTTDYSDRLLQVTELTDNVEKTYLFKLSY